MFPEPIQRLVHHFQKLPGIGPKQAARFAFRLLEMPAEELKALAQDIEQIRESVAICRQCFLSFKKDRNELCEYCRNPNRDQKTICIVETDREALAIESSGFFKGVYQILKSPSLPAGRISESHPAILGLLERINRINEEVEVILALSTTTDGETTALLLERLFSGGAGVKITRLGRGLSSGIEIEYADRDTLVNALRNRK